MSRKAVVKKRLHNKAFEINEVYIVLCDILEMIRFQWGCSNTELFRRIKEKGNISLLEDTRVFNFILFDDYDWVREYMEQIMGEEIVIKESPTEIYRSVDTNLTDISGSIVRKIQKSKRLSLSGAAELWFNSRTKQYIEDNSLEGYCWSNILNQKKIYKQLLLELSGSEDWMAGKGLDAMLKDKGKFVGSLGSEGI